MNTKTNQYLEKQVTSHECKPIPCDIPPFCRNNYFTGKLLTERDLTAEQRYLSDKLRLHHLALHGWGVICGLRVRSHPYCPNLRVIVEPGLAIDPCGRFIRVLKETEIELPKPIPLPAAEDPCPPDMPKGGEYKQGGYGEGSKPQPAGSYQYPSASQGYGEPSAYGSLGGQGYSKPGSSSSGYGERSTYDPGKGNEPIGVYEPSRGYEPKPGYEPRPGYEPSRDYEPRPGYEPSRDYQPRPGYGPGQGYEANRGYNAVEGTPTYGPPDKGSSDQPDRPYEQDYGAEPQPTEPCQPTVNLYFCLSYTECDDEMMAAPFDECACTTSGQKPNRICETFKLTVNTEPPKGLDEIRKSKGECFADDCQDLYKTILEHCKEPASLECLPLAVVDGHRLGDPVTEDKIDNWSVRPLLPSTQLLDQLIRCILDKVSTKSLTKIVDIGWTHRGEYTSREFMQQFIGAGQTPRGFEITFGAPIRGEGITQRTFQAIVVRYADRFSGGQMEVAPARVRVSNNRMRACLDIDPGYAERRLLGSRFDLFLLLRCGHVVDDNGLPVDGELLAKIDSDGNYVVGPPTGDSVQGGLFESWIRVRPAAPEEQK